MATEGGGTVRPLIELLRTEPQRFDSRQAVRVLERRADLRKAGRDPSDNDNGVVDFRGHLSLAFPTSDIESVALEPEDGGGRAVMDVNFIGLGGVLGPLPPPFTEFVLAALRHERKLTAPRDFLDLFNHRLIWLAMEAAKRFRVALQGPDPARSGLAQFLKAVVGLGTAGLEPLLRLRGGEPFAPGLLALAALIHQRPASAHAVERAIAVHFSLPARLSPFQGAWLELPEEDRTVLGPRGRNRTLGADAIAGTRIWDQGAGIEIALGPMPFDQMFDFLPGGRAGAELAVLLEVMLSDEFDVRVRLVVAARTVPASRVGLGKRLGRPSRLGRGAGGAGPMRLGWRPPRTMRLGWTSWLGRGAPAGADPTSSFKLPPAMLGARAAP